MCFISPLQAELSRGDPRGAEARAVAVLIRGCWTRPTRHQAEPEMLTRAERPRPGPRPPPASPFPVPRSVLLLLLAMLSAPVCGRVPRSVPRTSLPISGKTQGPLSSALCTEPSPCQQVPTPLSPANTQRQRLGSLCTVHTPLRPRLRPLPCACPSHLIPSHPTLSSHLSSQDTTTVLPEAPPFQQGAAPHAQTWIRKPRERLGFALGCPFQSLFLCFQQLHSHPSLHFQAHAIPLSLSLSIPPLSFQMPSHHRPDPDLSTHLLYGYHLWLYPSHPSVINSL